MLAGAFEDAAKAFANANDIKATSAATLLKAACYLRLDDVPSALSELQGVLALDASSPCKLDIEVLTLLKEFQNARDPAVYASIAVKELTQMLSRIAPGGLTTQRLLHWYKGLMFFYRQEYTKASTVRPMQEFQIALNPQNQGPEVELLFNISLCFAMRKEYSHAISLLTELADQIAGEERGIVMVLAGVLLQAQGDEAEAQEVFEAAADYIPELLEHMASRKRIHLKLMEDSQLPEVRLDVSQLEVLVKPCMKLPCGEMPSMEILHTQEWLQEFSVRPRQFSLIKCKYEAPWLNRVNGSIQFTELVQESSIVLSDSEEVEAPVSDKPRRCRSEPEVKSQMFSDDEVQVLNLDMKEYED